MQEDIQIFIEEIRKRVSVSDDQILEFAKLWEFRTFGKNEFISKAGEIPDFSIFVLKGCLRQFTINEKGDESIVYFAEERHFIGDLPAIRNRIPSDFYFQTIEPCELLTLSTTNWERSFIEFPWWVQAHMAGYQKWAAFMQQQMADVQLK